MSRLAWYVAALLGERPLVLVVDLQVRIEELSPYLEFRAKVFGLNMYGKPQCSTTIGLEDWCHPR